MPACDTGARRACKLGLSVPAGGGWARPHHTAEGGGAAAAALGPAAGGGGRGLAGADRRRWACAACRPPPLLPPPAACQALQRARGLSMCPGSLRTPARHASLTRPASFLLPAGLHGRQWGSIVGCKVI